MSSAIFWFRNDLRLHDNPALQAALEQYDEVLPVYILDERYLEKDPWGFVRMGVFRLQFLLESLEDLNTHLKEKGSQLLFSKGIPEEILPQLAEKYGATQIYATKEYTSEELEIEQQVASKTALSLHHGQTLYHPEDLNFTVEQLPEIFTQFRKRVEKYARVRDLIETPIQINTPNFETNAIPSIEDLGFTRPPKDQRAALAFKGGAIAAEDRLEHYFWDTDAVASYKKTRNGLIGADYSTKFSAWLANGCISPRTIWHEVDQYESERTSNSSTYWVKFELLWREYFKFVAMKHGNKIFLKGGIQDKSVQLKTNKKYFDQWAEGKTGDNFVDANMRELLHTGFMSNRGRQNVASYLVHQLKLDWRMGAAWFESLLVDYDVASNYGNWMYAAGVGNDPRDRVFNTKKQAGMYDGDGEYRKLWRS
ncbi:MAG: DASH family cryptochrome [Saprospiraceae bacterium]